MCEGRQGHLVSHVSFTRPFSVVLADCIGGGRHQPWSSTCENKLSQSPGCATTCCKGEAAALSGGHQPAGHWPQPSPTSSLFA